jgi:hypothetical protein
MCYRRAIPWAVCSVTLFPPWSLAQPAALSIPKEIAVPAGYELLFKIEARGVQIYKAVETRPGTLGWVLEAPLATLFDEKGGKAGWHYEGPSWECADGSKVIRDKAEEVKSAPAPKPQDDIPWLLVKVRADQGNDGKFSPAVYIQRLQTEGGKAPVELPKRVGTKVGVAYKAVYHFYGKMK